MDLHCHGSVFILCPRRDSVNSVLTSTLLDWEFFCIIDLGFPPFIFSILFLELLLVQSEPTKLIHFSFLSSFPSVLLVCFLGHSLKSMRRFYWIFIFYFPGDFLHLSFSSPECFVLAVIFKTFLLSRTLSCLRLFPLFLSPWIFIRGSVCFILFSYVFPISSGVFFFSVFPSVSLCWRLSSGWILFIHPYI